MANVNQKIQKALNEQIQHELGSSYLYLAMATYFYSQNLDGMAQWMRAQAKEELAHTFKIYDHLIERGIEVQLAALAEPKKSWNSPLEAFEDAYKHEQFITSKINELYKLAMEVSDNPALVMLQWFISEQVEEEASVSKVVETLKMIGNSGSGLVMLDRQLGKRE